MAAMTGDRRGMPRERSTEAIAGYAFIAGADGPVPVLNIGVDLLRAVHQRLGLERPHAARRSSSGWRTTRGS